MRQKIGISLWLARSSPPSRRFNLPLPIYRTLSRGVPTMKSKLLQKSYGVNPSREVVDGQRGNIEVSSLRLGGTRNRTTRSTWLLTPRRFVKTAHSPGPDL